MISTQTSRGSRETNRHRVAVEARVYRATGRCWLYSMKPSLNIIQPDIKLVVNALNTRIVGYIISPIKIHMRRPSSNSC